MDKTKSLTHSLSILFQALGLMITLSACVGTVQDAKTKLNEIFSEPPVYLSFPGIYTAKAISHNKIEIEFYPMLGATDDIRYFLYVNGSNNPIEINPEALDDAVGGRRRYLLKNLNINTAYKLKLGVKNIKTQALSHNEKEVTTSTFDNWTAEFMGINTVSKVVGATATTVKLEWVPATMKGLFALQSYDPTYYEIIYISAGGPQNLNNPNYTGTDRVVSKLTVPGTSDNPGSKIISGLTPNTTYYFQVRAVNQLYDSFATNPAITNIPVDRELNSRFLKIKTDAATSLVDFSRASIELQNPPGVSAYTNLNVYWAQGSGVFSNYRVYWYAYTGDPTQVNADDKLTEAYIKTSANFVSAASSDTSLQLSSLSEYTWYQVKVVLCVTAACPIATGSANDGIISNIKTIRTKAVLAPFSGLISIEHPKDAATINKIKSTFDKPTLSIGYADTMEMYCIDPNNYTRAVKLTTSPVPNGSGIGNCDGLSLDSLATLTSTSVNIVGVKNINTTNPISNANYCFAMTPAIRTKAEQIPNPVVTSDLIVRCISPEINVPTLTNFPGINGACEVSQNNATVRWTAPTGGIFSNYRVFIKEIIGADTFKFSDAIATDTTYSPGGTVTGYKSILLANTATSYQFTGLRPGRKYKVGVLSIAISGASEINSEYNVNVKECNTPLPTATFNEWTRIFAIGPKIDGRFPLQAPAKVSTLNKYRPDAHIWEAINVDGIPYEVKMNGTALDDTGYTVPPGSYTSDPTTFGDVIDGKPSKNGVDVYASKTGIISLAWKDVSLDFLGSEFISSQDLGSRNTRTYGYKVFRSDDNRLNWIDITSLNSKMIHAKDFKWRKRSNSADITEKMAFFTDYSVSYAQSSDPNIDRARTFWYKVVPYFEGKPLTFFDASTLTPSNMIKVTLPPPNMALVHRMMANRQGCLEIDKNINKSTGAHYRCDYTGLGSRPKDWTWKMDETVLDQGGDLLIDRYELGCNYTRGDLQDDPTASASYYVKNPSSYTGYQNGVYDFHGYPTNTSYNELDGIKFKGCTNALGRLDSTPYDPSSIYSFSTGWASYKKGLWGDCMTSSNVVSMAVNKCADPARVNTYTYAFPGARNNNQPFDCTVDVATNPTSPQYASAMLNEDFRRNLVTQSEFAAVMYMRSSYNANQGLDLSGPSGKVNMASNSTGFNVMRNCYINLASIGSDNRWKARWFSAGDLWAVKLNGTTESLYDKTIGEVVSGTSLFNNGEYKAPSALSFRNNSTRYNDNTTISRIVTSNSSKLPPLTGIPLNNANKICGSYKVEIGIGDNDTVPFLASSFPAQKRLLRKTEFTSAAAWPDTGSNHASSLNYTNTNIISLEASTNSLNTKGCVNAGKAVGYSNAGWKQLLDPRMPLYDSSVANTSLFTGSSFEDSMIYNSSKCISRYGVQDMVGNIWEPTDTVMNCDYTLDKMYFGVNNATDLTTEMGGNGDKNFSVPLGQSYTTYTWVNAPIKNTASGVDQTGNKSWVSIDSNSGYCSIVDTDSTRTSPSYYRDASNYFKNIFNSDGSLNISVVPFANPIDQSSVDYMRNGDAFFLTFGPGMMAAPMRLSNTMALSTTLGGVTPPDGTLLSNYFNPWTGLPLTLDTGGYTEGVAQSDNKLVTTTNFSSKSGYDPSGMTITNFPTGNSQISNAGIADFKYLNSSSTNGIFKYTFGPASDYSDLVVRMSFTLNGAGTDYTSFTTESKSIASLYGTVYFDNDTIDLYNPYFDVPRNSNLIMLLGGGFDVTWSGRYSMKSKVQAENWDRSSSITGIRCGLLINTED